MEEGKKDDIFKKISEEIGSVSSDLIEEIVKDSNEKKIMYHGIKKSHYSEKAQKEGIKPLTPESGPCSFWSTGIKLFHPSMDSPFFCYSGSLPIPPNPFVQPKYDYCELNLAITSYDLLAKKGLSLDEYKKDSQMKIKDTIPSDAIMILNVKVKHPLSEPQRKYRQIAEKILLDTIKEQIKKFSPGKVVRKVKEIKA